MFLICSTCRPFRQLDYNGDLRWERIKSLDKGQIYKQVRITVSALSSFSESKKLVWAALGYSVIRLSSAEMLHVLTCCFLCVTLDGGLHGSHNQTASRKPLSLKVPEKDLKRKKTKDKRKQEATFSLAAAKEICLRCSGSSFIRTVRHFHIKR